MESLISRLVVSNCAFWNYRCFIMDLQVPFPYTHFSQSSSAFICLIDWIYILKSDVGTERSIA